MLLCISRWETAEILNEDPKILNDDEVILSGYFEGRQKDKGHSVTKRKRKKKLASKDSTLKHNDVERRRFCLQRK